MGRWGSTIVSPQHFVRIDVNSFAEFAKMASTVGAIFRVELKKKRALIPIKRGARFPVDEHQHRGEVHGVFPLPFQQPAEQRIDNARRVKTLRLIERLSQPSIKLRVFKSFDKRRRVLIVGNKVWRVWRVEGLCT
jgi:hypothetical protein